MQGRTNACSGGSGLGFRIVGSTTRPANAEENTVWVNTATEITGYSLSATEPTPAAGLLWVTIGNTKSVNIAVPVGKDYIVLHLNSAKQYINGAWVSVAAKCYQGGVWRDFATYLIDGGNRNYTLNAIGKSVATGYMAMSYQTITQKTGAITITGGSDGYGIAYIADAIDLTPYRELVIRGDFKITSTEIPVFHLNAWTEIGGTIAANRVAYTDLNASGETRLDVSKLTGSHIVGIGMAGMNSQTIYDMWLA